MHGPSMRQHIGQMWMPYYMSSIQDKMINLVNYKEKNWTSALTGIEIESIYVKMQMFLNCVGIFVNEGSKNQFSILFLLCFVLYTWRLFSVYFLHCH